MKWRILAFTVFIVALSCKKEPEPKAVPVVKKFKREMKGLAIDSVAIAQKDSALAVFYRMNSFQTVWYRKENRKAVEDHLQHADRDGLFPEDYRVKELLAFEKKFDDLTEKELVTYDTLLTVSFRKYLRHLAVGKLNPRSLYGDWDLKQRWYDVNTILSGGISGDSLDVIIAQAKPKHDHYHRLEKALEILDEFPKDNLKKISIDGKIKLNDTSEAIIAVKKRLMYWKDLRRQDSLTAVYDVQTYKAVKAFQARHGLSSDGVIGKGTVEALNFSKEARRRQIVANMERWRWFPSTFGEHYIIVNIPGYEMEIVKEGDTVEMKRVVVGKIDRKTPVLTSTFNEVILNPTWTVPPTIAREDLTPAATKNRGYFAFKGITIYNWKGDTIPPEKWNPAKYNSYRYVQRPGDDNALGNVKFNFPNRYTVYLHDTNHREYFTKNKRSLSSGCVRVEDPLPLAEYMIADEKITLDSIQKIVATKTTTRFWLKEKIKIYQLYWTAWSDNGQLIFRDDIYNLDSALYDALRK